MEIKFSSTLIDGEYPVYYYNHDVPAVRKVADSFKEFLEDFVPQSGG